MPIETLRAADTANPGATDRVRWFAAAIGVISAAVLLIRIRDDSAGDEFVETDPQEQARELLRYVATPEERRALDRLETGGEVTQFVRDFYAKRDPDPSVEGNPFREEHFRRFHYAEAHFSGMEGGWKSDRGRAYIINGEPAEVRRFPALNRQLAQGLKIYEMEIWEYDEVAGGVSVPAILSDPETFSTLFGGVHPLVRKRKAFVFADVHGAGLLEQIFSTEQGEIVDPRLY